MRAAGSRHDVRAHARTDQSARRRCVLLHGWTATADLNWFTCYTALAEQYRVVALDHRGHGRGIRSRKFFRLDDCADDAVAVCDVLGIERFIPVGYSMGGPIAQLIWQRHRQRMAGLVLCATSAYFATSRRGAAELPRHHRARRRRQAHAAAGAAVADRAALPAAQGRAMGAMGDRGGSRHTTGGRCSRPVGRSATSRRGIGSARSTCPRRS